MKKDNLRTGIFIGRFQPFRMGHLSGVKNLAKKCDKLIIGVGSAEKHHTINNPFTFDERKMMIDLSLQKENISNCKVVAIIDLDDYPRWVEHVIKSCPEFDIVFTGNSIVKKLFEEKGFEVCSSGKHDKKISSMMVRKMMKDGENWSEYCSKGTNELMDTIKGAQRVKRLMERVTRSVADAIIELYDKQTNEFRGIPLIERKNPPLGWAIPGGFQDRGESLEETAIREAKEEVSLDIKLINQLKTYSDPKRDPRFQVNSTVFIASSYGEPKAADDAKTVRIFSTDEIKNLELAFDHKLILNDYFEWKQNNN